LTRTSAGTGSSAGSVSHLPGAWGYVVYLCRGCALRVSVIVRGGDSDGVVSLRHLSSGLAAVSAALVTVTLSAWPALAAGSVLTPSAQTVQAGETIDLSITGFKPCSAPESLAVLWDKNPLSYNVVAGSLTSNNFTVDIVVPSSPLGVNQIDAGCSVGSKFALQQQATVNVVANVVAPELAPSPQIVQAGKTVTISGSGFELCTTVELSANGTPLATASGSNGDFQQVIMVPPATGPVHTP